MTVTKWLKRALICASLVTLVACSSTHRPRNEAAISDANAAYSGDGAEASGLGEESGFGDQNGSGQGLSKRIYYFDFDSNVVHSEDRPAIAANGNYLMSHPNAKIILEGHTDPRGSREYNIGLGERRAKAVAEILTSQGVQPAQVRVVSYGAEKLAAAGHAEGDYQQDRRVVLVYMQR